MIDCPNGDVRDALPDYLHDRLDAELRRRVESHLAGCDACRAELSLLRALRVQMRGVPAVDVEAIAAAIPPYRAPAARSRVVSWRAAAAVVAFAVGGTSIALLWGRGPVASEDVTPYVQAGPTPHRDSATVVVAPRSGAPRAPASVAPRNQPVGTVISRELAMAGGSITDLSDGELSALVESIESLDAVPSTEVEGDEPMTLSRPEDI
jgi:anti-sigma factor RsiW